MTREGLFEGEHALRHINRASRLQPAITRVVETRMPGSHVIPYLCPGFTDAAFFSRLGARAYGFTPLLFARELGIKFTELFHGVDERISVDGFQWGNDVFYQVVKELVAPGYLAQQEVG